MNATTERITFVNGDITVLSSLCSSLPFTTNTWISLFFQTSNDFTLTHSLLTVYLAKSVETSFNSSRYERCTYHRPTSNNILALRKLIQYNRRNIFTNPSQKTFLSERPYFSLSLTASVLSWMTSNFI